MGIGAKKKKINPPLSRDGLGARSENGGLTPKQHLKNNHPGGREGGKRRGLREKGGDRDPLRRTKTIPKQNAGAWRSENKRPPGGGVGAKTGMINFAFFFVLNG